MTKIPKTKSDHEEVWGFFSSRYFLSHDFTCLGGGCEAEVSTSFCLSLDLEALKTVRDGSRWLSDPEHIRRRQELAYSLIQYAPVHSFVPGERVPQSEELEVDGEDGDEDEEEIDEEIQIDTPPEAPAVTDTAPAAPSI